MISELTFLGRMPCAQTEAHPHQIPRAALPEVRIKGEEDTSGKAGETHV